MLGDVLGTISTDTALIRVMVDIIPHGITDTILIGVGTRLTIGEVATTRTTITDITDRFTITEEVALAETLETHTKEVLVIK